MPISKNKSLKNIPMENMEKEVGENEIDVIIEEKEVKENKLIGACKKGLECLKGKIKSCKNGECKCKHKKSVIVAVVVLIVLVLASLGVRYYRQNIDIGQEGVKVKIQKFLSENVPETVKIEIVGVAKEGHLYKVNVTVDKQEVPLYITLDGKKLMQAQGVINLDQAPAADENKQAKAPEKTEAEVKSDVPVVDLFVMSYCPYGLQMERGVLPVVEALGKKIKFNLKFVDYTLHGQKEVTENINQYCIQKVAPTKLNKYLGCFWKDSKGTSATCMKTFGINTAQVATCVKEANEKFKPTEKSMGVDGEETVKFGVQGSPTLVVNGTTVASGRDSASVLKAICSGFTTAPKECEKALSATAPGAGFDDQIAAAPASAGGASAGAACGN